MFVTGVWGILDTIDLILEWLRAKIYCPNFPMRIVVTIGFSNMEYASFLPNIVMTIILV